MGTMMTFVGVVGGVVGAAGILLVAKAMADGVADMFRETGYRDVALLDLRRDIPARQANPPPVCEVEAPSSSARHATVLRNMRTDCVLYGDMSCGASDSRRLVTTDDHRRELAQALRTARRRVIIVSPQISSHALRADSIPAMVSSTVARGVDVVVFTDDQLNRRDGQLCESAQEAWQDLEEHGAAVFIVTGIHHKTLIVDDSLIADGSFNWLSAVRKSGHVHQRDERGQVTQGGTAARLIKEEMERLLALQGRGIGQA